MSGLPQQPVVVILMVLVSPRRLRQLQSRVALWRRRRMGTPFSQETHWTPPGPYPPWDHFPGVISRFGMHWAVCSRVAAPGPCKLGPAVMRTRVGCVRKSPKNGVKGCALHVIFRPRHRVGGGHFVHLGLCFKSMRIYCRCQTSSTLQQYEVPVPFSFWGTSLIGKSCEEYTSDACMVH